VLEGEIISNGAFVVSNNTGVNNAGALLLSSGWQSKGPLTISGNTLAGESFSSPAFGGNHFTFFVENGQIKPFYRVIAGSMCPQHFWTHQHLQQPWRSRGCCRHLGCTGRCFHFRKLK